MLTKEELPECPVATTVQLIGRKWKLLIIRNLLERPWRFNELKKGAANLRTSRDFRWRSMHSQSHSRLVHFRIHSRSWSGAYRLS